MFHILQSGSPLLRIQITVLQKLIYLLQPIFWPTPKHSHHNLLQLELIIFGRYLSKFYFLNEYKRKWKKKIFFFNPKKNNSYSTDFGDSYFGQESNKTILVVKAPDATPTSISSINIVNLKRDTSQFIVGVTFSIEAIGAVPSSRSILKFIQSSDCSGSGIEMPYNNSIVTMPTPFTSTGYYSICYSTDERGSWSLQNLVLFIYPPGATTTTITAVSPTTVYVLNPNAITFTGAIPSNQTKIAFVSKGFFFFF